MAYDRYSGYPASLTYAGPTTLNLQELHGVSLKPDNKKDEIIPMGNIDRSAVILIGAEPVVTFKTHDISTILTACSLTAGLATIASNLIQFQKRADGGVFASGSAHVVLTNKKGFLVPKRLTVSADKPAELELEYWCLYDGSTTGTPATPVPPLTIATAQALTSTPAFNGQYYLGPIYANGSQMPSVKDWDIDFGLEYKTITLDGDQWPQVGSIISRKPKLSASFTDVAQANTVGSVFNAATPGTLAFYLRKGVAGGTRSADSSSNAIKIAAATGAWNVQGIDADNQDDADVKLNAEVTGTLSQTLGTTIP